MSEWISVKDRLPPFNTKVLGWLQGWKEHSGAVWDRNGYGFFVRHTDEKSLDGWSSSWVDAVIKELDADSGVVTHWIALPTPPCEGGG